MSFPIFCAWCTETIQVYFIHNFSDVFFQIFLNNLIIFPAFNFDFGVSEIVHTIVNIEQARTANDFRSL